MIPLELQQLDRWVCMLGERPISCSTSKTAYTTKPATWTSYEQAQSFCEGCGGVPAFALFTDTPFTVIKLDDARSTKNGAIRTKAKEYIEQLKSYTEVDSNGTSVRVVVRGRLLLPTSKACNGFVELYDTLRFVPLTGHHLPGTPDIIADREHDLDRLLRQVCQHDALCVPRMLTDDEIIARAEAAYGEKFLRLWTADTSDYEHDEHAELALLKYLAFWTRNNLARMEALFLRSGLGGHRRWRRANYREPTLRSATCLVALTREPDKQKTNEIQRIDTPSCRSGVRGTKKRHSDGNEQSLPSSSFTDDSQGKDIGVEEALELADNQKGVPCELAAFNLARRLRRLSADHPEQFKLAVQAFAQQTGHDPETLLYAFMACWTKVKTKEGDDVLDWAFQMAKTHPCTPNPCFGEKYALVASTARHLAERTHPKPFLLPCQRLASLLGTSAMTVSNIISLLKQNRFIKCVDEDYKFTERKAKSYELCNS